jgi:DnaJ-class molecular chaperone
VTQAVPAERGAFISIGLPHSNTDAQMRRALKLLKDHGFQAAPSSDEAVLAMADLIRQAEREAEEADRAQRAAQERAKKKPCPDCGGLGRVAHAKQGGPVTCATCGGRGEISTKQGEQE